MDKPQWHSTGWDKDHAIPTQHYKQIGYAAPEIKLPSSIGEYGDRGNIPLWRISSGFVNNVNQNTWPELMKFDQDYYKVNIDGKPHYLFVTAYNRWALDAENVRKHGPFHHGPDDDKIDDWIGACNRPKFAFGAKDYDISRNDEFKAFYMAGRERKVDDRLQKYVTDIEIDGPYQKIGEMLSRTYNGRSSDRSFRESDLGQLAAEEFNTPSYSEFGVTANKGTVASTLRAKNGYSKLMVGLDASRLRENLADYFGSDLERAIEGIAIFEEYIHARRPTTFSSVDAMVQEERFAKGKKIEYFTAMRDRAGISSSERSFWNKMARYAQLELDNVEEYREIYSKRKTISKQNLNHSYESNKDAQDGNDTHGENLEEIVDTENSKGSSKQGSSKKYSSRGKEVRTEHYDSERAEESETRDTSDAQSVQDNSEAQETQNEVPQEQTQESQ